METVNGGWLNGGTKKTLIGTIATLFGAGVIYVAKQSSEVPVLSQKIETIDQKIDAQDEKIDVQEMNQRDWNRLFLANQEKQDAKQERANDKLDELLKAVKK